MEKIWGDGFEGEYYWQRDPYTGEEGKKSHTRIPIGWGAIWVQGIGGNVRPEWKPREPPQREIFEGAKAIGVHTTTARHHTVLHRTIPAEVGVRYQLRVRVLGDSSHDAGHGIAVGIDPFGSTDWGGPDPKWQWWATWDNDWANQEWRELMTPIVAAQATRITLYLRSWAKFPANAAAVFDRLELWADEGKPPHEPPPTGEIDYERIANESAKRTMELLVAHQRGLATAVLLYLGGEDKTSVSARAVYSTFGGAVRDIRKRFKLNQTELAEKAGLSRNTVSAVERDEIEPSMHTLRSLAGALELPLSELLDIYQRTQEE
jgi:DNA-binding XRE family transcriptional regulator